MRPSPLDIGRECAYEVERFACLRMLGSRALSVCVIVCVCVCVCVQAASQAVSSIDRSHTG